MPNGPTTRARIEAALGEHESLTIVALRALLADIKPKTVEYTLWTMVRTGAVVRTPGGPPRNGVEYRYALALDDDGWCPQPWQHPYACRRIA